LKELKSIRDLIAELREILSSDKKLKQVITAELKEVHKAYGDDRRTQIVDKGGRDQTGRFDRGH